MTSRHWMGQQQDPTYAAGARVAAAAKRAEVRELDRLFCDHCTPQRQTISVTYVEPNGALWLWTPGQRAPVNHPGRPTTGPAQAEKIPPRAVPIPTAPGQRAWSAIGSCPRCRRGWLLLPNPGGVTVLPLGHATHARVVER